MPPIDQLVTCIRNKDPELFTRQLTHDQETYNKRPEVKIKIAL